MMRRLLLVDADAVRRRALRAMLGRVGPAEVSEAGDGEAAAELLRLARFDCVVLAEGAPGAEGRAMRSALRATPVVRVAGAEPRAIDAVRRALVGQAGGGAATA